MVTVPSVLIDDGKIRFSVAVEILGDEGDRFVPRRIGYRRLECAVPVAKQDHHSVVGRVRHGEVHEAVIVEIARDDSRGAGIGSDPGRRNRRKRNAGRRGAGSQRRYKRAVAISGQDRNRPVRLIRDRQVGMAAIF